MRQILLEEEGIVVCNWGMYHIFSWYFSPCAIDLYRKNSRYLRFEVHFRDAGGSHFSLAAIEKEDKLIQDHK